MIARDATFFEGSLPKQRFEMSRNYKGNWKMRFLRLHFDRLEYGKWNKKGRLILRQHSPMALNDSMEVTVGTSLAGDPGSSSSKDFSWETTSGLSPRFIKVRVRVCDAGPWQLAVFQDDPHDKRRKGSKLLKQLRLVEKMHKTLQRETATHHELAVADLLEVGVSRVEKGKLGS